MSLTELTIAVTPKQQKYLLHLMMTQPRYGFPTSYYPVDIDQWTNRTSIIRLGFDTPEERNAFVCPTDKDAVAFSRRPVATKKEHAQPRLYVNRKRIHGRLLLSFYGGEPTWMVDVQCDHDIDGGPAVLVIPSSKPLHGTCSPDSASKLICEFTPA